jgi:hypothetical protein
MNYIRSRDGATVTEAEALDAGRVLKDGYRFAMLTPGEHIGFDMAFMDSRPAPGRVFLRDTMLTDAETSFAQSPEGREAIAYAKSCAAVRDACGGTRTWTDSDERAAIQSAMIGRDKARRQIADQAAAAPGLRAAEDAALRMTRDTIRDSRNK